jgi:hypothetical protein
MPSARPTPSHLGSLSFQADTNCLRVTKSIRRALLLLLQCLSKQPSHNDLLSRRIPAPVLDAFCHWPRNCTLSCRREPVAHISSLWPSPKNPGKLPSSRGSRVYLFKKESSRPERASGFLHQASPLVHRPNMLTMLHMIRLDYLSCILTVLATVLIGKKLWQGWVVAAVNSAVVCVIGVRTAQFGFVPANLLCIALYTSNLVNWRPKKQD